MRGRQLWPAVGCAGSDAQPGRPSLQGGRRRMVASLALASPGAGGRRLINHLAAVLYKAPSPQCTFSRQGSRQTDPSLPAACLPQLCSSLLFLPRSAPARGQKRKPLPLPRSLRAEPHGSCSSAPPRTSRSLLPWPLFFAPVLSCGAAEGGRSPAAKLLLGGKEWGQVTAHLFGGGGGAFPPRQPTFLFADFKAEESARVMPPPACGCRHS